MQNPNNQEISRVRRRKTQNIFDGYTRWIRSSPRNQAIVALVEDGISRISWLVPYEKEPRWRQILWALLQIHSLVLNSALENPTGSASDIDENEYGATVKVPCSQNRFPIRSIKMALYVIQSITPLIQQACDEESKTQDNRRTKIMFLWMERIRFALRYSVLLNYWKHFDLSVCIPGILQTTLVSGSRSLEGLTAKEELSRIRRERYEGTRTGRRVSRGALAPLNTKQHAWSVIVGEFLYILRPLFWAQAGLNCETLPQGWTTWLASLGIDCAALALLDPVRAIGNEYSMKEYKRRKMRLFLYLLRSPAWNEVTEKGASRISALVCNIPFFGRLLSHYLYDWLYYWKYYRSEE